MKKGTISVLQAAAMIASVLQQEQLLFMQKKRKKDKYVIGMSQCNLG